MTNGLVQHIVMRVLSVYSGLKETILVKKRVPTLERLALIKKLYCSKRGNFYTESNFLSIHFKNELAVLSKLTTFLFREHFSPN